MDRKIYLDNAATTIVSAEVINEMMPIWSTYYGNSSSLHSFGREAAALVDKSRDRIAAAIKCESNEIYFTSGGTEANNWAILGLARANKNKGNHIITSQIEHHSVLDACKLLEKEGFRVTYLPVDSYGVVKINELLHYICKDTILISVMAVNNEVGTINHLKTISKIAKDNGVLFHSDCVQALGAINIDVKDMEIDALSVSAHKIYGPKGIGALFLRKGVKIEPFMLGGNQERGKRGGTLNVPGIIGFGKACEIAIRDLAANNHKLKTIRDYFIAKVLEKIDLVNMNGHPQQKVNGIVSLSFEMIEGEAILLMLDMAGIAVSTGSACTSGTLEQSYVLKAMGVDPEIANGTIRFSFPKSITKEEIDYTIEQLEKVVNKLRSISPLTKAGRGKK